MTKQNASVGISLIFPTTMLDIDIIIDYGKNYYSMYLLLVMITSYNDSFCIVLSHQFQKISKDVHNRRTRLFFVILAMPVTTTQ